MNIGVIGAIGVDDIGDVIMLEQNIRLLENIICKKNLDAKFIIFALNQERALKQLSEITSISEVVPCLKIEDLPSDIFIKFDFQELLKLDLKKIINNRYFCSISKCDALYFIGGGYFNKYWGNRMITTFVLPIALGYQLKKPIYISGVNLGPFDDSQSNKLYGLFDNIDTLILRDRKLSIKTLEKLGGISNKKNLILGADDVLPKWYCIYGYYKECDINSNYAVINLHHLVERNSLNSIKFYKILADFFNWLLDNNNLDTIYFLPFDYFKGLDYECGRRLKTYMDDRKEYVVLEPTKDHIFMRQVISNSKFLMSSRYHPIVFGVGEQIPTLGIYTNDLYKQKINGVFETVNTSGQENMIYIKDFSYDKLKVWYKNSVENNVLKVEHNYREKINFYKINREKSLEKFVSRIKACNK